MTTRRRKKKFNFLKIIWSRIAAAEWIAMSTNIIFQFILCTFYFISFFYLTTFHSMLQTHSIVMLQSSLIGSKFFTSKFYCIVTKEITKAGIFNHIQLTKIQYLCIYFGTDQKWRQTISSLLYLSCILTW